MSRFRVGPCIVDIPRRRLSRDGSDIPLPWRSFEALRLLIAARGETVARDELLRALWTDVAVEESSLPKCISQLRKALGDEHATLVETVPRLGYRLAAPAEEIIESAAAPPRRRWLMVAGAAIVALAVAGAFALWLPHRNRGAEAERHLRAT